MYSVNEINELIDYGYLNIIELEQLVYYQFIDTYTLIEDENLINKIKKSKVTGILKDNAKYASKLALKVPFIKGLSSGVAAIGGAAKTAAIAHPAIATGVAAAGAAYGGYKLYKHMNNKIKMLRAHKEAHNEAIKNIEKTHGQLGHALKPYVHEEVKKVVNAHKDEFKKNPQDIHKKIVDHFKSDDFKNKMLRRAGLDN